MKLVSFLQSLLAHATSPSRVPASTKRGYKSSHYYIDTVTTTYAPVLQVINGKLQGSSTTVGLVYSTSDRPKINGYRAHCNMVGVAGRSKGCDDCRRRHRKCDLVKPKCGQCTKSRLECGGFRDLSFILYDNGPVRDAPKKTKANNTNGFKPSASPPPAFSDILYNPIIPRDDIFTAFTRMHFLPENPHIVVPAHVNRTLASQCFLALSYTYFGLKHQDREITRHGLHRYSHALTSLNSALPKKYAAHSFDVLESIMLMALIEHMISDREDGWVNHARGLERIFALRGPKQMSSLPCVMILEQTRTTMIFAAIILRKPTILARPEWKTEPWVHHPERIDPGKLLFDILSDCPELFVLRDQAMSEVDDGKRAEIVRDLYEKARSILKDLEEWGLSWAADSSTACTEVPAPPSTPTILDDDGNPSPAWSTIFEYQSLMQCAGATMYNGALILVVQFVIGLEVLIHGECKDESLLERLYTAGMIICRSVDYHMHYSHTLGGDQSAFFLLFPLRMAHEAVGESEPAVGLWLRGVLEDITSNGRGTWKSARSLLDIRM